MAENEQDLQPDLTEPSYERQAELRDMYHPDSDAPYEGAHINTLGELKWIYQERGWYLPLSRRPNLSRVDIRWVILRGANLRDANLRGANLFGATLSGADLSMATLSGVDLSSAILSGSYLYDADLSGADLSYAKLDKETKLTGIILDHRTKMMGIKLNDADLTEVDWSQLARFGDDPFWWWQQSNGSDLDNLARTYRRLSATLRNQGLSEDADRYANRAQICQRGVYFRRIFAWPSRLFQYLFSHLLNLVAGYGYHPERSVFWYIASIVGFAFAYTHFGAYQGHPFHMDEAIVFSLTSFHGRGFFPGGLGLDDPITKIAAAEAVVGLFIEISFIATFTQRYFGK